MNATAAAARTDAVRLFLCGDVMTGRGVDQILPCHCAPRLYEAYVQSAEEYVALAEGVCGPVKRGGGFAYPWGDALAALDAWEPAARIINLETAVTRSEHAQPGKGIHYRMHPGNVACITAAGIDCAVLANNHVLDWGREGLAETLSTLHAADVRCAGAGPDANAAAQPAEVDLPGGGRLLVYAFATGSSGVPPDWAATPARSGVNYLESVSDRAGQRVADAIGPQRRRGDLVIASIHWGGNWGWSIPPEHRAFAHRLVESGAVDLVHGHSSHHVQAIEVVRDKLVLYGCGDLINDYEGIEDHGSYRPDLALMYFPLLDAGCGTLQELAMVPMRRRRLRLQHAVAEERDWLARTLQRVSEPLGSAVWIGPDGTLQLASAAAVAAAHH